MNVGLDLRGSLGPAEDLGFGVDVDPLDDRGVLGFPDRLALEGGLCDDDDAGIVSLTAIETGGSSGSMVGNGCIGFPNVYKAVEIECKSEMERKRFKQA